MAESKLHSSMEIVYRILTWGIMGFTFLMLMPIFSIGCLWLPEKWSWVGFVILPLWYVFLLYLGWKSRIKKDIIVEPVKNSRIQSVLLWTGFVQIVFAVFKICIFNNKFTYLFSFNIDYLLLALLFVAAILTGIFLPFKKHTKAMCFASDAIIVGIIINLFVLVFSSCDYNFTGRKLPHGYEMPSAMQDRFFPDGAYNFEIKGKSMMFANSAEWNCNVSEKDFEKFRQKHKYNFVLNRSDVNEDRNVGPLHHSDETWQKPYYFYNNRHANGGGLTMRYSVPEQKLYGRYSNR